MKKCPVCGKLHKDEFNFCLEDGNPLEHSDMTEQEPEMPLPSKPAASYYPSSSAPSSPRFGSSAPLRSFGGLDKLDPSQPPVDAEESEGRLRKFFNRIIGKK
jgi:hypothetical protein